jgi:hypothetical protein
MKKLLIVFALLSVMACKKDDEKTIPNGIYGTYTANVHEEPSGSDYIQQLQVNSYSTDKVKMILIGAVPLDSFIVDVDGSKLSIYTQSTAPSNSVSGDGSYSGSQIDMEYTYTYSGVNPPQSKYYTVSATKQ